MLMKQTARRRWQELLGAIVMAAVILPVPVSAMTVFGLDLPRSPLPTLPAAAAPELLSHPATPAKLRAAASEPKPVVVSLLGVSAIATPPPRRGDVSAMADNPTGFVPTSHALPSLISVPLANVRSGSSSDPPATANSSVTSASIATGPPLLLGTSMSRMTTVTNFSTVSPSSGGLCYCRCGCGITIIVNITINDCDHPSPCCVCLCACRF